VSAKRLSWIFDLHDRFSPKARTIGRSLDNVEKKLAKTNRALDGHQRHLGKAERATRKLGDAHKHAGMHGSGFFMKLTGWYMGLQMGIMMVQGLTRAVFGLPAAFAKAGLAAAAWKEQTLLGLGTMLGSEGAGSAMLAEADRMAKATGTPLREMVERYTQLTAMGFKGDQMRQVLAGVGDLAIVGGQDKASRALLAITQIKAKGRLSAEELMQQLAETGVDIDAVYGILGRRLGLDKNGVRKAMEKGGIGADVGIESILEFIQGRYSGGALGSMAAKYSKTGGGMWNNLTSSVDRFLMDLDKSAGYQKAKQALANLVAVLDPETPEGKRLKARATELFDKIMGGLFDAFQDPAAVSEWVSGLIDGFGELIPTAEKLAKAVGSIAENLDKVAKASAGVMKFLEVFRKITPAGWFAEALDYTGGAPKSEQEFLAKHYGMLKQQPRAWNTDKQMRHIEGRFRSEGWTLPGAAPAMPPPTVAPALQPSHKPTAMHLAPGAIKIEVNGAQDPKAVADEVEERMASVFERLGIAQGVA
jgi:tape measure domain-containing protein